MDINSSNRPLFLLGSSVEKRDKSLYLKDKKKQESLVRIEVVTINGRIKRYAVSANGKKTLISEEVSKEQIQKDSLSKQPMKSNTAETMELLNHLMGVGSSNFAELQINEFRGTLLGVTPTVSANSVDS